MDDLLFFLRFFELECDVGLPGLPILGVDREPICGTPGLPRANFAGTDGEGPAVSHHFPGFNIRRLWRVVGQLSETSAGRSGSFFDPYPCFKCWIWLTMCCGSIEGPMCPRFSTMHSQDLPAGCHPKATQ